jgi:hypothetical protein
MYYETVSYRIDKFIQQSSGFTVKQYSTNLLNLSISCRNVQVMYGSKKLQGFKKPETNVQNFTFQATTTLQGGWGLTSVGPRTNLRNPIGQK